MDNLSTSTDSVDYNEEVTEDEEKADSEETDIEDFNPEQIDEGKSGEKSEDVDISIGDIEITSPDDIDFETRKILSEFVIDETNVDYLIIKEVYNSKEVVEYFYENYGKRFAGGIAHYNGRRIFFDWNTYRGFFRCKFNNIQYVMKPKVLENIIRHYIRENYSVERIIKVLKIGEKK